MPRKSHRDHEEYTVGDLAEFPEGGHKVVRVGRREIGIFNVGGRLYGLPNLCPHQTGPLCAGKPALGTLVADPEDDWKFRWVHEGEIVACPWHGLEYHVPTGRCVAYPNITLRSYEVVVEGGKVKVRI